ncbi:hypothetical protein SCALM49S_09009 [Streptomyces californicus]
MVRQANSPAPIPVSRGLGNRRSASTTGGMLRTRTRYTAELSPGGTSGAGGTGAGCGVCLRCGGRVLGCSTRPT